MTTSSHSSPTLAATTLAALGVVFGDIGTSPLYALRECFHGAHAIALTRPHVLGVLSLVLWSLILIISIKYVIFVLRADNEGEGGILALMTIALRQFKNSRETRFGWIALMGMFGAALLYGDGVITPAITVMSAVEGLNVATPVFEAYVIPLTIAILIALFMVQKHGTARVGKTFGPVIVLWFVTLGILGIRGILMEPSVLSALDPRWAIGFLREGAGAGFVVLGSVFLAVTGGEALYADLGHFGARPIRVGWFCVALPGLVLQYFGQGAILLSESGAAASNPFFMLAPTWMLYPLVILATLAAIIASQAIVTGAFSLSQQASQLGLMPRIEIQHTSRFEKGQIYVPFINWALLFGTLYLVLEFQSSTRLAGAYGIAVAATMAITSILLCVVMAKHPVGRYFVIPFVLVFLTVDLAFVGANAAKIWDGGWFPLLLATAIMLVMTTWKRGREILRDRLLSTSIPIDSIIEEADRANVSRTSGLAVFMAGTSRGAPAALVQNWRHNRVLHQYNILLTITTASIPHVEPEQRVTIEPLGRGFFRVIASYGFMEGPHVPELIESCVARGMLAPGLMMTFFMGRETLVTTSHGGMSPLGKRLFGFLSRNAYRATDYFKIPSDQVIEIGTVVEL